MREQGKLSCELHQSESRKDKRALSPAVRRVAERWGVSEEEVLRVRERLFDPERAEETLGAAADELPKAA